MGITRPNVPSMPCCIRICGVSPRRATTGCTSAQDADSAPANHPTAGRPACSARCRCSMPQKPRRRADSPTGTRDDLHQQTIVCGGPADWANGAGVRLVVGCEYERRTRSRRSGCVRCGPSRPMPGSKRTPGHATAGFASCRRSSSRDRPSWTWAARPAFRPSPSLPRPSGSQASTSPRRISSRRSPTCRPPLHLLGPTLCGLRPPGDFDAVISLYTFDHVP